MRATQGLGVSGSQVGMGLRCGVWGPDGDDKMGEEGHTGSG